VVYLVCLGVFVLLIIPCALAGSLEELIVVRFIGYVLVPPLYQHPEGRIKGADS
jgi:hypothetical protein